MPRIRTIKPEALQHRKIGRRSIWARWLWLGIVTQADDEGRLVADPGQLRLLAFGYDEDMTLARVSDLLAELAETGLIVLYEVKGVPYAALPSWNDHQRIDKPKSSKLPPPPRLRSTTRRRRVVEASMIDRLPICVDQGSSIKEGSDQGMPSGAAAPMWPSPEALVELYHQHIPAGHPRMKTLTAGRRQKALAFMKQFPDRDFWVGVFSEIPKSALLMGQRPSNGHKRFLADFDWVLTRGKDGTENCVKVAEGKYRDAKPPNLSPGNQGSAHKPGYVGADWVANMDWTLGLKPEEQRELQTFGRQHNLTPREALLRWRASRAKAS